MTSYECKECRERFETCQQLQEHLRFEICHANVTKPIICAKCDKEFTDDDALQQHTSLCTQSRTIEEKSAQCAHCDRAFSRHCKLQAHLAKDVCRRGDVCCVKCSAQFKSGMLLEMHRRETQCGNAMCTRCGKMFTTHLRHRYKEHIKVCNNVDKREVNDVEVNVMTRQRNMCRMRATHDSNESVCCVNCRLQFEDDIALRQHVDDGICRMFYCHLCECSLRRRDAFDRHMRAHRMVSRTSSLCSHCHRPFADAISLRTHAARGWCPYQRRERTDTMREVLNEQEHSYSRPARAKEVAVREVLKRCAEEEVTQKSHMCPFCTKLFQSQTCLNEHVYTTVHEGNACLMCMTLFDTHEELRWHYQSDGDCTFVCDGCECVFADATLVKQHRQQPCDTNTSEEKWQWLRYGQTHVTCMKELSNAEIYPRKRQTVAHCSPSAPRVVPVKELPDVKKSIDTFDDDAFDNDDVMKQQTITMATCRVCQRSFDAKRLKSHERLCALRRRYMREEQLAESAKRSKFERSNDLNSKAMCTICKRSYAPYVLYTHMRLCAIRNTHWAESKNEKRRAYLREYNREYGKRKRNCPKCGKSVSCKHYADHIRRHSREKSHREKKPNFTETTVQCMICLKNVRNCNYARHLQRHNDYKEDELRTFSSQQPKAQSKENAPVPCHICQKKITRNNLKRHILHMHGDAKQRIPRERYIERPSQFECDMCGLSYKTAKILAKHKNDKCLMRGHALPAPKIEQQNEKQYKQEDDEELLLNSPDSTRHICQFCDLVLSTTDEKLEHELVH